MKNQTPHSFHIPVMGLGFTIDTPLKVGRFGISSVLSIIEDNLIEQMREYYCNKEKLPFTPIEKTEPDFRAKRITAYLDLLDTILQKQMQELKRQKFDSGSDLDKYFLMLEENSFLKLLYKAMLDADPGAEREALEKELKKRICPGNIDVNIMTKCDRSSNTTEGNITDIFSDALSALRGFANSKLQSSIVFSAGLNPRLFSYCESFESFFPCDNKLPGKRIIIKVSDYRSAQIQGKFLAKKGLLVSEFRIESGLNCGGHAFPTEGLLLGPILHEFREKRQELQNELLTMCNVAWQAKGRSMYSGPFELGISVQGGIGTAAENKFLLDYYKADSTGWGSPFLLVPEATNVDEKTLNALAEASPSDYYLSHSSPLGIPFNNFRRSSSEVQRIKRIEKGRPGSPCYKKFLSFNTEFTDKPICTASRQYQNLKIKQLQSNMAGNKLKEEIGKVLEKDCLCEGLAASAIIKNKILKPKQLNAVAVCPGPNLAYFSGTFSLQQMVGHIYGRESLLNNRSRPNMFLNELNMYYEYYKKEFSAREKNNSKLKYLENFKKNMLNGIEYYKEIFIIMEKEIAQKSIEALSSIHRGLMLFCPDELAASK